MVRITARRNSFYVTLGLSRLLYNYSTAETMELYNLIIQDPDVCMMITTIAREKGFC